MRLSRDETRTLWAWWTGASAAGLIAGFAGALVLVSLNVPLTLLVEGAGIGLGQWLLLRRYARGAGWWIAASALGMQAGAVIGYVISPSSLGPITLALAGSGAGLGVGQWLLLRRYVRRAAWWIPISCTGILAPVLVGVAFGSSVIPGPVRTMLLSPLYGGITGLALIWLAGQRQRRAAALPLAQVQGSERDQARPSALPEALSEPVRGEGAHTLAALEIGQMNGDGLVEHLQRLYVERVRLRRQMDEVEQAIGRAERAVRQTTRTLTPSSQSTSTS